jgi:hypothetical protein
MVFKNENDNIIDQNEIWKYEPVGSDDNTVYFKTPSDNYLRFLRNQHCFSIINRGRLWYDTLNETQIEELKTWYMAWLDVTETKVIPDKPSWLK